MLIENEFEVAAPVEQVWKYLLDVPRMAPCMPGAELTEVVDKDTYKGRVTTKLGPVSLRFAGTAHIVERNAGAKRVVVNATGSEEKGKGQASMAVTSTLVPAGKGTRVKVSQELQISGAAAQYGRGMIQDVTNVLMKSFASNVQDDIGRWSRGEGPSAQAAAPVKGFSVGIQATLTALKRFFRRFVGGKVST